MHSQLLQWNHSNLETNKNNKVKNTQGDNDKSGEEWRQWANDDTKGKLLTTRDEEPRTKENSSINKEWGRMFFNF